jgi:hypothetical protein
MAIDQSLYFHATTASGATFTSSTGVFGPTVDLGSSSTYNRTILVECRIAGPLSGTGSLDITFEDSTDGTSFTNMPGATGALLGFARTATTSYGSTDAVAAEAPRRIVLRTDKRYVRAEFTTTATTVSYAGVTVIGKPMGGAFSGAVGPRDT